MRLVSVATVLECTMVMENRKGPTGGYELDMFIHRSDLEIVAVTVEQLAIARLAWRKFGKGRHPAALNFGDCFAYALAKISNEPLLAKGADFPRTDLIMAV
jgi:ribonuclease VapC